MWTLAGGRGGTRHRTLPACSHTPRCSSQENLKGQLASLAFLAGVKVGRPLSVTELVRVSSLSMKVLFFHIEETHLSLQPGVALPPELKQLKADYVVSTVAFNKYKQLFQKLFTAGFAGGSSGAEQRELAFQLGWITFLIAKSVVPWQRGEFMGAYHLLTCVLHLLLAYLPTEARSADSSFWPLLTPAPPPGTYPLPQASLAILSGQLKVQPEDMAQLEKGMPKLVEELEKALPEAAGSEAGGEAGGGLSGVRVLFDGALQPGALQALSDRYGLIWPQKSTFDERVFLEGPSGSKGAAGPIIPASPSRQSSAAQSVPGTPGGDNALTPLRGPNSAHSRSARPRGTPISSHLESIGWLQRSVRHLPDAPDESLQVYFSQCDADPADAIRERLERLCGKVSAYVDNLGAEEIERPANVDDRCNLAKKLYYKMLGRFLSAEEKRLNTRKFTGLLNADLFHTSLFACCIEAVFASYSTNTFAFPAVIRAIELLPFDFAKVIDSFFQYENDLPSHLKAHFHDIDSKILESLAWEDDSPLHGLMQEYEHSKASPGGGAGAQGSGRAKAALEQFLRKVLYLAASRIQEMCTRLLLPTTLRQQVWECLKTVIYSHAQLLQGRHLDQLIMCTVYGVCKVNQRHVTFRHIIEHYKGQPKATPKVFREVRIEKGEAPQDIICFYNKIFIPSMKDPLMRICCTTGAAVTAPLKESAVAASASNASPQRVQRDLYVSQPRTPSALMTPRTRTLYAFGDTPAEKLQRINHQINCQPGSEGAAMNALRQLGSGSPSGSVRSLAPTPTNLDDASRKRPYSESGPNRHRLMQRRLLQEQGGAPPVSTQSSIGGDGDDE